MLPETRSEQDDALSVRAPAWDQARRARFLPASSDQFAAHRFARKPLALLLAAPDSRIALSEQLVQAIARPMLRFHNQPTALDCNPDFCPRLQLQQVEQSRWHSQHDRAADLTQICGVHNVLQSYTLV